MNYDTVMLPYMQFYEVSCFECEVLKSSQGTKLEVPTPDNSLL